MKLPVYNITGVKTKEVEVSSRIFGVKVKPEVVHQVVVAQMANARKVLADTLNKSEVRGGGKKPWKQKGTGKARHGSSRSPIWVGGGVTFGPTNDRNFSKKVNKKQKQLALAMCLSDKLANESLAVFEKLSVEGGKTKNLNALIKTVKEKVSGMEAGKKFLLIIDNNDKELIRSGLNLRNINTISYDSLNCIEVLKYDKVLASEEAISKIAKHYRRNTSSKLVTEK